MCACACVFGVCVGDTHYVGAITFPTNREGHRGHLISFVCDIARILDVCEGGGDGAGGRVKLKVKCKLKYLRHGQHCILMSC